MPPEMITTQNGPQFVPKATQGGGRIQRTRKPLGLPFLIRGPMALPIDPGHRQSIPEIKPRPNILPTNHDQVEMRPPALVKLGHLDPMHKQAPQDMSSQGIKTPIGLLEGQILLESEGQKSNFLDAEKLDAKIEVFVDTKGIFPLVRTQPGDLAG